MAASKTLKEVSAEANELIDYTMNIYQKMSKVTEELQTVAKNLSVPTGKSSSYKAVSEVDIINAVKPLETKYGIYSYPINRKVIESGLMENETIDYNTKQKLIKKNIYLRVETTYRFVNTDKPEDYIDMVSYGDGTDTQDKAPGKAMTYSDKYALMKAYKIATGEDTDETESGELKEKKTKSVEKTEAQENTAPIQTTSKTQQLDKAERDRQDNIKACMGYRDELKKVGVDYLSSKVVEWCKQHSRTGITTMDLNKLNNEQIIDLCNLYANLYNSKKAAVSNEQKAQKKA